MPDTAGSVASGAASGAATGTAILPGWGTAIGAVVGGIGGYLSASGTSDAQSAANKAAAQNAAAQSAQSFLNYLSSRGINVQQLIANDPRGPTFWTDQYKSLPAGDGRDFNTWFAAALQASPTDPAWDVIANPSASGAAQNTTLPAWAVDANGNPLQPSLLQQLVGIQSGTNTAATAPIGSLATVENIHALFQANPSIQKGIADNMAGSDDKRTPEQWLVDHITQTESQSGGGTYTDYLRNFLTNKASGGDGNLSAPAGAAGSGAGGGAPGGPAGAGSNLTLDPAIQALLSGSAATLAKVQNGTLLREQLAGQQPVADARTAAAAAQAAKIEELRGLSGTLLNTELGGIGDVTAARTTGAGGIYDATVAGADSMRAAQEAAAQQVHDANVEKLAQVLGVRRETAQSIYDATVTGATGVRDATKTAAQGVYDTNVDKLAEVLGVRREAAKQIYDATAVGAAGVRDARTTGARGIYDAESLKADSYAQSAEQALSRALAQNTAERLRQGFTGGSSGANITDARLRADALQQGAGARAQAGVNLAGRLSDTGTAYATDLGTAGVGQATTLGAASESDALAKLAAAIQLAQTQGGADVSFETNKGNAGVTRSAGIGAANEADAVAQLNAAVELAKSLGLAGTNYAGTVGSAGIGKATTLASAGEQDAIAQLQAKVADATRRLGYLTSDADIAAANADLANAQDALAAIVANQNREVSAISSPFQLAGSDLALKQNLTDQQYADIDALLKRLGSFTTTPASGPALQTSTPGAVLNGSQIAGGALSGLGSVIGNTASNQSLADLIKQLTASSSTVPAGTGTLSPAATNLASSGSYLGGSSVFQMPKGPG